jgi:hypothetical protein
MNNILIFGSLKSLIENINNDLSVKFTTFFVKNNRLFVYNKKKKQKTLKNKSLRFSVRKIALITNINLKSLLKKSNLGH